MKKSIEENKSTKTNINCKNNIIHTICITCILLNTNIVLSSEKYNEKNNLNNTNTTSTNETKTKKPYKPIESKQKPKSTQKNKPSIQENKQEHKVTEQQLNIKLPKSSIYDSPANMDFTKESKILLDIYNTKEIKEIYNPEKAFLQRFFLCFKKRVNYR